MENMTWIGPLIMPILIAVLSKLFPYRKVKNISNKPFRLLQMEYQVWSSYAILPAFIFLPSMTYVFGEFLYWLFMVSNDVGNDVVFYILPQKPIWYVPGGIIAFALLGFFLEIVYKLKLKENYEEYMLYSDLKYGIDGAKAMRFVSWVLGILAATAIVFINNYSIKITDKEFMMNEFATLTEKTYTFDQIESVNFVKFHKNDSGLHPSPHYYVKFKDGSYWNTNSELRDEARNEEIIGFLIAKSKLKMGTLLVDPK